MALSARVGTFVANTSTGNQAVTGVGFAPEVVVFFTNGMTAAGYSADAHVALGWAQSSTARNAIAIRDDDNAATINAGKTSSAALCITMLATGSPGTDATADLVSLDGDGFTVNWTDAPAAASIINYVALAGPELTGVKAGTFSPATATGNQAVTGVGFQPDLLMMFSTIDTGGGPDAKFTFGAASSPTARGALTVGSDDGVADSVTWRYQRTDRCLCLPHITAADSIEAEADLVSFNTDGFTLNWLTALATGGRTVHYLALKGGRFRVGAETQKTSTGTKATTGLGFGPTAMLFLGVNAEASATLDTAGDKLMLGASDGTHNAAVWAESVDGQATSNTNRGLSTTRAILHATSDSTTDAEATITFDGDGFTADWTAADAVPREFLWIALGAVPGYIPRRQTLMSDAVHRAGRW